MKKVVALVAVLMLVASSAYALGNNHQGQDQDQGQVQGQLQGQGQDQGQSQNAIATQAQGQISKQGNSQGVTVEGDDVDTYVMTAPHTVAGDGQNAMGLYSIFGGVNTAESAEYKVCIELIRTYSQAVAAGLLDKEVAIEKVAKAIAQMEEAAQPKRVLGFLWKTRGKHLLNGLGLLSTDDGYAAVDKWINKK